MVNTGGLTVRILSLGCALFLASTLLCAQSKSSAGGSSGKKATASKSTRTAKASKKRSRHSRRSWRYRGQRKIDAARAKEIQQALIRERYLTGQADGVWGKASEEAMERYQADNGWQTKVVPDSRALIKLGLGPDHDGLLNPATAMTGPIEAAGGDARSRIKPAAATEGSAKSNAAADPGSSAKPTNSTADPARASDPQR
jgi:putative peptidoglycan binding protein